jgi:Big-like domain-containing protein
MRSAALLPACLLFLPGCPTRDHLLPGVPDGGTPSSISITAPTSPTYTNGSVEISVAVQGVTDTSITLQANGSTIGTVAPPQNSFEWDTTSTAEGSYQLTAATNVGGRTLTSSPITIVVDRTAPTIKTLTPTPGASNVVLAAPLVLTFSEPVVASAITPSFVSVAAGAVTVPTTLTTSADAQTVTVEITDKSTLTLPATFTASFSTTGITDLAGNQLVLPAASWTWMVPDWIKLAPFASSAPPQLVVGPDLHPIVSYQQCVAGSSNGCEPVLHVTVNDGQAWNDLGTPGPDAAVASSLAVDSKSQPVVSWAADDDTGVPFVSVSFWNGSGWAAALPPLSDAGGAGTSIDATVLRLDGSDNPIVGWKHTSSSAASDVFVAHWNGLSWDSSFGQVGLGEDQSFDLEIDDQANPTVGFLASTNTGAATWNGSAWTMTPFIGASTPFVALDASGSPLMLETSSGWIVEHLTGDTWLPAVSSPLPVSSMSTAPHLLTDGNHHPIVAWVDESSGPAKLGLARWTGTKWDTRPGLFNAGGAPAGSPPALAVDARGSVWVAWSEALEVQVWMSNY